MAHRHIFMALDRTLRDIISQKDKSLQDIHFSGKIVIFGVNINIIY